jgi:hypothetical protein
VEINKAVAKLPDSVNPFDLLDQTTSKSSEEDKSRVKASKLDYKASTRCASRSSYNLLELTVIQALAETCIVQSSETAFDDFIAGKGRGIIILLQ